MLPSASLRNQFDNTINGIKEGKDPFYNYVHRAWIIDNGKVSLVNYCNNWENHAEYAAIQYYIASLKGYCFEEDSAEIESY